MAHALLKSGALHGGVVHRGSVLPERNGRAEWKVHRLAGQLIELSGAEDSAALTCAFGLVREAQLLGDPVVWITLETQSFLAADVADGGVDLAALPIVRLRHPRELARAADQLTRSGAFGLVVIDLPPHATLKLAMQSRLLGLAQKHATALLFLTQKAHGSPSLGSLVSLRAQTRRRRVDSRANTFACELCVTKDKRRRPGWRHEEICRGPVGLH